MLEHLGKSSTNLEKQDWDSFTIVSAQYLRWQLDERVPDIVHTHNIDGLVIDRKSRLEARQIHSKSVYLGCCKVHG